MKENTENIMEINVTNNYQFDSAKLTKATAEIFSAADDYKLATLKIAGILGKVATDGIYKSDFETFGEYAEKVFGFKKSKASQLKTIGQRFIKVDDSFNVVEMPKYSYSQLLEMRKMDDEEISKIPEKATIKEIREIANKENESKVVLEKTAFEIFYTSIDKALAKYDKAPEKEGTKLGKGFIQGIREVLENYNEELEKTVKA